MKKNKKWFLLTFMIILSSCGGKGPYIENPKITIFGQSTNIQEAMNSLFFSEGKRYRIQLCEADANTKQCINNGSGISAIGIGGIFLPLIMDMKGIEVSHSKLSDNQIIIKTKLDAKINKISPWCGIVKGKIVSDNASVKINLSNFYCNWAVIGNVLTNINLSIDSIDTTARTFSGFYKISFYGTGNATGSGFFKASIINNNNIIN